MNKVKMIFRLLLGAFMTYAGVSHLTFNRLEFVAQVPMWLRFSEGFTDFVVLSSGVVEIALGLSMLFLYKHKAVVGRCSPSSLYSSSLETSINISIILIHSG